MLKLSKNRANYSKKPATSHSKKFLNHFVCIHAPLTLKPEHNINNHYLNLKKYFFNF